MGAGFNQDARFRSTFSRRALTNKRIRRIRRNYLRGWKMSGIKI
jgi:hypothetical protein